MTNNHKLHTYNLCQVRYELLYYRLSSRKLIEYVIEIQEGNLKLNVHVINITSRYRCKQFLFYNKFISCLYVFRAHVLIIRRSKLHYTASGIITPVGGRLVHELITEMNILKCTVSKTPKKS